MTPRCCTAEAVGSSGGHGCGAAVPRGHLLKSLTRTDGCDSEHNRLCSLPQSSDVFDLCRAVHTNVPVQDSLPDLADKPASGPLEPERDRARRRRVARVCRRASAPLLAGRHAKLPTPVERLVLLKDVGSHGRAPSRLGIRGPPRVA
jgi:hypothetical protein